MFNPQKPPSPSQARRDLSTPAQERQPEPKNNGREDERPKMREEYTNSLAPEVLDELYDGGIVPVADSFGDSPEEIQRETREWIQENMAPIVTDEDIEFIDKLGNPKPGDVITDGVVWSQEMIDELTSQISQTMENHFKSGPKEKEDGWAKACRICLRYWRLLPTQIVSPMNGLAHADYQGGPDRRVYHGLVHVVAPRKFWDEFATLLVHPAWADNLSLFIDAMAFASICAIEDERPWTPQMSGHPFLSKFVTCRAKEPSISVVDTLKIVKQRLRAADQWPYHIFNIFEAIAGHVRGAHNVQTSPLVRPIRASELTYIANALDSLKVQGVRLYRGTADRGNYVIQESVGRYKSSQNPCNAEQGKEMRKRAFKVQMAEAIAVRESSKPPRVTSLSLSGQKLYRQFPARPSAPSVLSAGAKTTRRPRSKKTPAAAQTSAPRVDGDPPLAVSQAPSARVSTKRANPTPADRLARVPKRARSAAVAREPGPVPDDGPPRGTSERGSRLLTESNVDMVDSREFGLSAGVTSLALGNILPSSERPTLTPASRPTPIRDVTGSLGRQVLSRQHTQPRTLMSSGPSVMSPQIPTSSLTTASPQPATASSRPPSTSYEAPALSNQTAIAAQPSAMSGRPPSMAPMGTAILNQPVIAAQPSGRQPQAVVSSQPLATSPVAPAQASAPMIPQSSEPDQATSSRSKVPRWLSKYDPDDWSE
ncbi:hypothetical protein F4778DRAFT_790940 [Xylariomycetidae sp. FL2044]|nr:hypothetical protein F4778DRAFT_790940 [Xylariomycetidae sp. FL2044]